MYVTANMVLGAPDRHPATPVIKSITEKWIVCLCCGEQMTTLGRHLVAKHDMTAAQYRLAFGLSPEYPLSAPALRDSARSRVLSTLGKHARKKRVRK